jgi:arabinose-5-phosphate isomerase
MTARQRTNETADGTAVASARRTFSVEAAGIKALSDAVAGDLGPAFEAAVARIRDASGRVIVTGMGKSGHVGRKIAATLSSTGTPAFFVHPGEASHGDLGMIAPTDVILALSWSGETSELSDLIDHSRRFRVPLVAITAALDSTLARSADVALVLPKAREACPHNLAPTTSSVMQLALGDALAVALLESRGFTALDFKALHPGGKLGASLKFLRDIMHRGAGLPLARVGSPMSEAIVTMTSKGLGCIGVVDDAGRLRGVITDGDLRRHMAPDLLVEPVEAVMNPAPKTMRPDQIAGEALEYLNESRITAIFVVDDGRPVGVVHIHDLLRIGVA